MQQFERVAGRARAAAQDADHQRRIEAGEFLQCFRAVERDLQEQRPVGLVDAAVGLLESEHAEPAEATDRDRGPAVTATSPWLMRETSPADRSFPLTLAAPSGCSP